MVTKQTVSKAAGEGTPKSKGTIYDALILFLASALILAGLIMIIMGDARSDYVIGAGIVIQVLYMVVRAPRLFNNKE